MTNENIIFPQDFANKKISKKEMSDLINSLTEVIDNQGVDQDTLRSLAGLLVMPEEEFRILAPGILESYKQSLNNPNDKLILVQALNAAGSKAEDVVAAFDGISEEIDKLTNISRQKRDFVKELVATICNSIVDTEGIAKRVLAIPVEICSEDVKVPQYANISDSGMDIYALEDVVIKPGETKLIPTGIKVALPPGYEFQVRPKSGRALKTKLRVANTPGTIDAGYRDEIKVIIENIEAPIKDIRYEFDEETHFPIITSIEHGENFYISKGEKFAQLVLVEVSKATFFKVESVLGIGENRGGGFGSTSIYDKDDSRYDSGKV